MKALLKRLVGSLRVLQNLFEFRTPSQTADIIILVQCLTITLHMTSFIFIKGSNIEKILREMHYGTTLSKGVQRKMYYSNVL